MKWFSNLWGSWANFFRNFVVFFLVATHHISIDVHTGIAVNGLGGN